MVYKTCIIQPLLTYTTSFPVSLLSHSPAVTLTFFLFLEHAKHLPRVALDAPQILPPDFPWMGLPPYSGLSLHVTSSMILP